MRFVVLTAAFLFSLPARAASLDVSIVGTSDLHGRLSTLPLLGGYIDALRAARADNVVLVDAGDMFQGTLESDMNEGEAVVSAYELLGYNAVAIGNHDFDFGPIGPRATPKGNDDPHGALKARALQAQKFFPFLAANIQENGATPKWPNVKPSTLVKLKNGLALGIIGVTTIDTPKTTIAANFGTLTVVPLADAINAEAKKLRTGGAQVVIAVAHAGGRCQKFDDAKDLSSCDPKAEIFKLAEALPEGSVDAIIGGHVHAGIAQEVHGIPISEAFAQGQAFGRIDLTYDTVAKRVVTKKVFAPVHLADGQTYEGTAVSPKKTIEAAVAPALQAAQARRQVQLGVELKAPVERSYSAESALGNFVTSAMLAIEPRAKIAITNGGGLRADLPAGPLNYGAVYTALPFDNRLVVAKMTGAALKALFAKNIAQGSGVLSIAGAKVTAQCGDKGLAVMLSWPQGAPVKDDETFNVVTSDFLASGGDGFAAAEIVGGLDDGAVIREAIVDYIRKNPAARGTQDWYKKETPRLALPKPRPVSCS